MILDAALIRRRREELGLSLRAVANHLGVAASVVVRLEVGDNHPDLNLAAVVRLAEVLGLDPTTLFPATPTPTADDHEADGDDDAATVGALLHGAGVVTPVAAIAESLAWPKDRIEAALATLNRRLRTVGLRLNRISAGVSILRNVPACDAAVLTELIRRHIARDGLNLTEATMLYRIRTRGAPTEPTNPQAVALGVLRNADLIEPGNAPTATSQAPLVLSDAVRFSLLLDEEPGDPDAPGRVRLP